MAVTRATLKGHRGLPVRGCLEQEEAVSRRRLERRLARIPPN